MRSLSTVLAGCCLLYGVPGASQTSSEAEQKLARIVELVKQSYPRESLRRGEEGVVHFKLELNRDGKLYSCAATKSSGFPRLDEATCNLLVKHAFFKDAERAGLPRTTSILGTVDWKLPEASARPSTPAAAAGVVGADLQGAPLICKRKLKNGSLYIRTKLCLTNADWRRAEENSQAEGRRLQESVPGQIPG